MAAKKRAAAQVDYAQIQFSIVERFYTTHPLRNLKRGNHTTWKESSSGERNEECSVDNYNDIFSLNLLR